MYLVIIWEKNLLLLECFAQRVGVSFTTVNTWEEGRSKPLHKTMKLIDNFCKKKGINFNTT